MRANARRLLSLFNTWWGGTFLDRCNHRLPYNAESKKDKCVQCAFEAGFEKGAGIKKVEFWVRQNGK